MDSDLTDAFMYAVAYGAANFIKMKWDNMDSKPKLYSRKDGLQEYWGYTESNGSLTLVTTDIGLYSTNYNVYYNVISSNIIVIDEFEDDNTGCIQKNTMVTIKEVHDIGLPYLVQGKDTGTLYEIHPHNGSASYGVIYPDGSYLTSVKLFLEGFDVAESEFSVFDYFDVNQVQSKSQHKCYCDYHTVIARVGCRCGGV